MAAAQKGAVEFGGGGLGAGGAGEGLEQPLLGGGRAGAPPAQGPPQTPSPRGWRQQLPQQRPGGERGVRGCARWGAGCRGPWGGGPRQGLMECCGSEGGGPWGAIGPGHRGLWGAVGWGGGCCGLLWVRVLWVTGVAVGSGCCGSQGVTVGHGGRCGSGAVGHGFAVGSGCCGSRGSLWVTGVTVGQGAVGHGGRCGSGADRRLWGVWWPGWKGPRRRRQARAPSSSPSGGSTG